MKIKNTFWGIINKHAIISPQHAAIIHKDTTLTFSELDKRSSQLANFLTKNHAVTAGDSVAIIGDRSIDLVISFVALFKIGAIYIPVDKKAPTINIIKILKKAKPALVLGDTNLCFDLPNLCFINTKKIEFNSYSNKFIPTAARNKCEPAFSIINIDFHQKAIQRNFSIQYLEDLANNVVFPEVNYQDKILMASSVASFQGLIELWSALTRGASLVCVSFTELMNEQGIEKLIKTTHITCMIASAFLYFKWLCKNPAIFFGLKHLVVSSEQCSFRTNILIKPKDNRKVSYSPDYQALLEIPLNGCQQAA